MTSRELENLRLMHEALLVPENREKSIQFAFDLTSELSDEFHTRALKDGDSGNVRSRGMLALIACVKEPLAVIKLNADDGAILLLASGGAAKLFTAAPKQPISDDRLLEFLKFCVNSSGPTRAKDPWRAPTGGLFRLLATPIPSDPSDTLLIVRFIPALPLATTDAELESAALRRGLTPCEAKVFVLMARGLGNKEIARDLKTSYHTIRAHLRNIFKTLKVSSRVEAIAAVRG